MKGKITFIQILLFCVCIVCVYLYIDEHRDKSNDKTRIEAIQTEVTPTPQNDDTESDSEQYRINRVKDLYTRNNDTVGWVRIKDTAIDYPVLQNTQSNAYYLHRDFDRQHSSSGIPFMDYQCKSDATSDNTIIYGHNMRNGTMFHDLLKYADNAFYESHKIITFDTSSSVGEYEIFSVMRTKVGSKNEFKYYDFVEAKSPGEFDVFIRTCKENSIHASDITPQYGDKILSLSTCSYNTDNERFVVFAKKIK